MRLSAEKRFLQTSWYVTTLQWCTEISGEPAVMKQAFLVDVLFVQSEWLAEVLLEEDVL
ncbi:hypothetical protein T4B_5406 [Trichinella pseudospiralis]|uniref:Uncharacterized protein n=1 Tax=Trichinella pseudospiralis TaxID=6337 RepID=A0A0V1H6K6_TRIPS|nr:hypothetical protein T4B_5406 [Trichinella pseudospiralis]